MPEGEDPDDYINKYGRQSFIKLLKEKQIIQTFIWNHNINKVNLNNPYEVSNFDKDIKKFAYSIQDETLKKYVLEDFLERLKKLTPLQSSNQKYKYTKFSNQKNFKTLKETQILHNKRKGLSRNQILEFSILYIILNNVEIALKKTEELSDLIFISEKNEILKNEIIQLLSQGIKKNELELKINRDYNNLVKEIKENSNIQLLTKNKNDQEVLELIDEFIIELREQNNLKKIESLEKKLVNNLDENSFSELIKLKSQLNRE